MSLSSSLLGEWQLHTHPRESPALTTLSRSFLGPQPLSGDPPMTPDPRMTQKRRQRAQVGCLLAPAWPDLPQGRQRGSREAERGAGGPRAPPCLAVQGAFSLRSQLDLHGVGVGVKASPSLRSHPSKKLCLGIQYTHRSGNFIS